MSNQTNKTETPRERARVVIIGAGFTGIEAAKTLAGKPVDVEVLDRNNYHTFVPLLYQVGGAQLEASDIVYPVRSIFRGKRNVGFRMLRVDRIQRERKTVQGEGVEIPYDYLVLAAGSRTDYLGVPGAREHALPFKTVSHALAVRNWILNRIERASATKSSEKRKSLLTCVLVGGGPTGVELAGSLAELVRKPLSRDFPDLDLREFRIFLVEAVDRILPGLSEKASAYAQRRLQELGVQVRTGALVEEVLPTAIRLKGGEEIATDAVVWVAGVRGHPLAQECGLPTAGKGAVAVDPFLRAADDPNVFVAGDLAYLEQDGRPLPMTAQVAVQQGRHVAKNILRDVQGRPLAQFRYRHKGSMVAVGRGRAVADMKNRNLTGILAWPPWAAVHIGGLVGFRNRFSVLLNWAADYLFSERALRLILPFEQAAQTEPEEEAKERARTNRQR